MTHEDLIGVVYLLIAVWILQSAVIYKLWTIINNRRIPVHSKR